MEFRTKVIPPSCESEISHQSHLLLLGSCFSDNMSRRLSDRFFNVVSNPFGTLYNPASIHLALERAASGNPFTACDIFQHNGLYHSPLCHSSLSRPTQQEMTDNLNSVCQSFRSALTQTDYAILTFGTAWIFEDAQTGNIVANCHKLPASRFTHRFMGIDECHNYIMQCVRIIRSASPNAKIILTLSPIRHLADGAHGNQISKATLLIAIEKAVQSDTDIYYFPSYEICLDDLRDYRFFGSDMCHLTETACDYIFERFSDSYFSEKTKSLAERCLKISKRISHRMISADPKAITEFRNSTESIIRSLLSEHPYLKEAIENITV